MRAADLNLRGAALAAALQLEREHPDVVFTSGRRDVAGQAHAMASNVVHNRKWIVETYAKTSESTALQSWVNKNPTAVTVEAIAAGLQAIMATWTDAQKAKLSKHFSGDAFDVQPVGGERGAAIVAAIRKLPGLKKFLTMEGGLTRWHAQFA